MDLLALELRYPVIGGVGVHEVGGVSPHAIREGLVRKRGGIADFGKTGIGEGKIDSDDRLRSCVEELQSVGDLGHELVVEDPFEDCRIIDDEEVEDLELLVHSDPKK